MYRCSKARDTLAARVEVELRDDPRWCNFHAGPWNWREYWGWARHPQTFATEFNMKGYADKKERVVEVYSFQQGKLVKNPQVYGDLEDPNRKVVRVLRGGGHYDMLLQDPDSLDANAPDRRKRLRAKQSVSGIYAGVPKPEPSVPGIDGGVAKKPAKNVRKVLSEEAI